MFSLIRRKSANGADETNEAFESTTVSLSTAVPRPMERREDERISAMLRVGKLIGPNGEQQLVKVKNLSAGGLMAIVGHCDLLERGVVDASEAVREIRSAAESGARLARELLLAPGCPAAGSTTRRSE